MKEHSQTFQWTYFKYSVFAAIMEFTSGLLFVFMLSFATASTDKAIETLDVPISTRNDDPYRLPTTVLPEHYELILKLDEDFGSTGAYTGSVTINISTTAAVQEIVLHSKYLNITAPEVYLTCNEVPYYATIYDLSDYEMISLIVTQTIPSESNCILEFGNFTGVLGDDMYGFYRSYYTDENNQTVYVLLSAT